MKRKISSLILAIFFIIPAVFMLSACGDDWEIQLNQNTLTLEVGDTFNLVGKKSTDQSVITDLQWESSNTQIATINNGVLTAIGKGSTTITARSGSITATCSVSVVAKTYSITYELNGGVNSNLNPASYNDEDQITLSQPTKQGYSFAGWTGSNGQTAQENVVISIGTTGNLNYTANWTANEYTIHYNVNNGLPLDSDTQKVNYESQFTLKQPTRTGYEFLGWYNNNTIFNETTYRLLSDITLTAEWEIINYNITYVLNQGTNHTQNPQTFTVLDNFTLLEPTKTGYKFVGWYLEQSCINSITAINGLRADHITVYAKWELETYNINYVLNGGENNTDNVETFNITDDEITLLAPSKTNYAFDGWYLEENFINLVETIDPSIATNITVYAKWSYTGQEKEVTFVLNYSNATTVKHLTQQGKVTFIPERTGYVFNGWWLSDGETSEGYILSTKYDTNQLVLVDDLVLYAEWVEAPMQAIELYAPTVRLNGNNLEWDSVSGAVAYDVIISFDGNEIENQRITETSITFTDSYDAGYYAIKIRSVGDGINSVNSAYVLKAFAYKTLTSVTGFTFDITTSVVSWSAVKDAESYEVYVDNNLLMTISETSYNLSSFDAGEHSVKIIATKQGYISSQTVQTINKLRLLAPTNISLNLQNLENLEYVISWTPSTNANSYILTFGNHSESIEDTTYTISSDSEFWNIDLMEFTIQSFDTNTNYLISSAEIVTFERQYKLTINAENNETATSVTSGNMYASSESNSSVYAPATQSTNNTVLFAEGKVVTVRAQSESDLYVFAGWFNGLELLCGTIEYSFKMPKSNLNLTAKWIYYTLTTTSNIEGAGGYNVYNNTKIKVGESVTVTATANNGYNFEGWYNGETLLTKQNSYTFVMGNQNLILTTKWSSYTLSASSNIQTALIGLDKAVVTFDYNDGSTRTTTQIVTSSNNVEYPQPLSRDGYIFTGWYSDKECTTIYDFETPIVQNITLFAGWYKIELPSESFQVIDFTSNYNTSSNKLDLECRSQSKYVYFSALNNSSAKITITPKSPWANNDFRFVVYNVTQQVQIKEVAGLEVTPSTSNKQIIFVSANSGDVLYIQYYYNDLYSMATAQIVVEDLRLTNEKGRLTSSTTINQKVSANEEVTLTAELVNGYTFVGWYNGEELVSSEVGFAYTMTANNVNLVSKYIECPITLEKNINNAGEVSGIEKTHLGKQSTITASVNPGYAFLGWYKGDELLTNEIFYTFTVTETPVVYTAKFTAFTLTTLVNNVDAGSIERVYDNEQVTPNQTITVNAITNDGYTFIGWYNNEELVCETLEYEFVMPNENTTITAKWIACPVDIQINNELGGSVTGMPTTSVVGESYTLNAVTNQGYTFDGWYNGETLLAQGLSYTFEMTSEPITITAKWIVCPIIVEKNVNIGWLEYNLTNSYIGKEHSFLVCGTYDGYTFIGWYNGETLLQQGLRYTCTMTSEPITLIAKFLQNALTLNKNIEEAGSVSTVPSYMIAGETYTVSAQTNKGYTFDGWYNGEELLTKDLTCEFTMISDYLTLTAKWTYYTVTATVDNEQHGTIIETYNNTKITAGEVVTVSANSNYGYTFVGWFDENTLELLSEELEYQFTMPYSDISIVAKWTIYSVTIQESEGADLYISKAYSVEFDLNGGSGNYPTQYVSSFNPLVYPDVLPTKHSSVFTGWYLEGSSTPFDFTSKITENITLYAGWYEITDANSYNYFELVNPVIEHNSDATKISHQHNGASAVKPNMYYFAALSSSCEFAFYYKTASSTSSYGTYFTIYNVTQDAAIMNKKLVYNTSYNEYPFTFTANAGDVLYIKAHKYNYNSSYDFYIEGAKYPSDRGTAEMLDFTYDQPTIVGIGEYLDIKAVVKPGYTFDGFYINDLNNYWTSEKQWLFEMGKLHSTIITECKKYEITVNNTQGGSIEISYSSVVDFDLNGGEGYIDSQYVTRDQALLYPDEIPTKKGHIFTGWYTTPDCTNLYDFTADIIGNMTLFAGYEKIENNSKDIEIIDITKYNNKSNYYSRSNFGSSSSNIQYTYFTILSEGTYKLNYKAEAETQGANVKTYFKVVNITKNQVIRNTECVEGTYETNVNFSASAGDVICVENYSYSNGYYETYHICVIDIEKPNDGGNLHSFNGGTIAIPEYSEVTIVATANEGYRFLGLYEVEYNDLAFGEEISTFEMGYYHHEFILEARWEKI